MYDFFCFFIFSYNDIVCLISQIDIYLLLYIIKIP